MVPPAVTANAPPNTIATIALYPIAVRKAKPKVRGVKVVPKAMRTESLDVSITFWMSISKPAKNSRNTIPKVDKRSNAIKDSELNKRALRVGIPRIIPARICPTIEEKPIFLKMMFSRKAAMRIIDKEISVSDILLFPILLLKKVCGSSPTLAFICVN